MLTSSSNSKKKGIFFVPSNYISSANLTLPGAIVKEMLPDTQTNVGNMLKSGYSV